ncbi:MAG TPA: transposase [Alcanivorax sp.]|nr:transposase [Alcanivorax sp.]
MSGKERLAITGYSHYILQQGHNNEPIFRDNRDYQHYLATLHALKQRYRIQVQAWCMLENEVHLLLCPEGAASSLSDFIQNLAGRHTRAFNTRHKHRGTLWQGRYCCSVVEPNQARLECLRYLELLPVLRGHAKSARFYHWSSYGDRMGKTGDNRLDPDPDYLGLADNETERRARYREFLAMGCDARERAFIETTVRRSQLLGGPGFVMTVERLTGKRIIHRGPGRPRKTPRK